MSTPINKNYPHIVFPPDLPSLGSIVWRSEEEDWLSRSALASAQIEGCTLTHRDLERQALSLGIRGEYKAEYAMVTGVARALDALGWESAPAMLSELCALHGDIVKGTKMAGKAKAGVLRTHNVRVGNVVCPPWEDVVPMLKEFFEWLDYSPMTIERAFAAHALFEWIHPFGDGNGRTGRILEAQLLVEANVPTGVAALQAEWYLRTLRDGYYRHLGGE